MHELTESVTVRDLVDRGILDGPIDGNHGEIHPRGDDFIAAGVPFITAADIKDGRVDIRGCAFISETQAKSLRKGFARLGDVLLTHKATMGRTAIIEELPVGLDWIVLTPQVTYYRVLQPDVLDPRYLRFYFDSPDFQKLLQAWSGGGSTRAYLGITKQLDLPIPLLPIHRQRGIAETLSSLNDKIEQNRRTGRALETLAQATFKAWFVDFEPVKAKAAGDAGFPGMSPATFAALPDRLTDSTLGPVPKGWTIRPLSKVATFLNGLALQKYPPVGDGSDLPVIKIAELRKGSTAGAGLTNANVPDAYLIKDGDLLFSWSGTLEVEFWYGGHGALNQHLFKVTSDAYPAWLCFNWLRQHLPEFRLIASSKATTMGHIKRGHLDDALVVVPDEATLRAVDTAEAPVYELLANLAFESRKLGALRDYLLPRLLCGQVRVQDVAAMPGVQP